MAVPQGADIMEEIDSHRILHCTHPGLLLPLIPVDKRGFHTSAMSRSCGDSHGGRKNIMVDQVGPEGVPRWVPHDHD